MDNFGYVTRDCIKTRFWSPGNIITMLSMKFFIILIILLLCVDILASQSVSPNTSDQNGSIHKKKKKCKGKKKKVEDNNTLNNANIIQQPPQPQPSSIPQLPPMTNLQYPTFGQPVAPNGMVNTYPQLAMIVPIIPGMLPGYPR